MEIFLCKPMKWLKFSIKHLVLACALIPLTALATEQEQTVPSTITQVTVFLNQAQVTRVAKTNLAAGVTHLVFTKISPFINLNSLQVKTEGNVTLLAVSQRNNFLQNNGEPQLN